MKYIFWPGGLAPCPPQLWQPHIRQAANQAFTLLYGTVHRIPFDGIVTEPVTGFHH
jgi:hypothetical protein